VGVKQQERDVQHSPPFFFCFLDRAFFNDEENNQQNALINSSINLLMSDHSNMFRLPS
jgi:hypothetical protein